MQTIHGIRWHYGDAHPAATEESTRHADRLYPEERHDHLLHEARGPGYSLDEAERASLYARDCGGYLPPPGLV